MKPYLISAATRDVADEYLKSSKVLKDSVECVNLWYPTYPGHMYRLDGIIDLNLDPKRWWIFVDTADVTFQRPFPDFTDMKPGIIVCDEGQTHTNHFWEHYIQMYPMFSSLRTETIYNCGTVAMPGHLFLAYIKYFKHFRDIFLPKDVPQMLEQLIFNKFVQKNKTKCYEVPGLFSALSSNFAAKTALKKKGIWVNKDDTPFVVVHRNGNTKNL